VVKLAVCELVSPVRALVEVAARAVVTVVMMMMMMMMMMMRH
jgi:hypothetical protein